MYINKPKVSEDFYKLFVKGMPLKPITPFGAYRFRRKGWNIYTYFVDGVSTSYTQIEFYTVIGAYYPDWKLRVYKYVGKN